MTHTVSTGSRRRIPDLRWRVRTGAALLGVLLAGSPLAAQELTGRVLDGASDEPIEDALLFLLHPDGYPVGDSVASSPSGGFTLAAPGPGSWYIQIERIGYTSIVDGVFDFESEASRLEITVYLLPAPVELEGVDVTVDEVRIRRSLRTNGFYQRAAEGFGDFISPEEIEDRGMVGRVSEYLRSIPGVTTYRSLIVFRGGGASGGLVRVTDDGLEPLFVCEPNVWVDGTLMTMASKELSSLPREIRALVGPAARALNDEDIDMGIDAYLTPNDIVAIEVYRTAASTPLQWGGLGTGCGTVVIWTKRGR